MLVEFWHRDFMFDFVCHQMVLGQYQDPRQVTVREKVQSYRLISFALLLCFALLHFVGIVFFTDFRSVASLHQASLWSSFFQ